MIPVLIFGIISLTYCNASNSNKAAMGQNETLSFKTDSVKETDSIINNISMATHSNDSFYYDLNKPDERYILPKYLQEISGLVYYKDDRLLCVQDEKANIYDVNLDNRKIINKYHFGEDGDYEDIAIVGQTAYVIRSDGNIFEVESFENETRQVKVHKTPLSGKNDTEGITYDKNSNSLLIACKGSPALEKGNQQNGYKAIYRFDLEVKKLVKEPAFLIDLQRPDSYKDDILFKKFFLRQSKKNKLNDSGNRFNPSALAIHPVSGDIYLISNIGKVMIILDKSGKITDFHFLDPSIFRQPEGICFSPGCDLYIANEGNGRDGYILKFEPD